MIVTLSSLKGGVGKSTIALHLASAIALAQKRVLLVDADPQASAGNWAAARNEPPPFTVVEELGCSSDPRNRVNILIELVDYAPQQNTNSTPYPCKNWVAA